jgi:hypothetical protein
MNVTRMLSPLVCIREVPNSKFDCEAGYPEVCGFSWSLQLVPGWRLRLGKDRVLPYLQIDHSLFLPFYAMMLMIASLNK